MNLDDLTYEQLLALNREVVTRIKHMRALKSLHAMAKMNLGQRVCFDAHGTMMTGTVVKFNQKTVVVHTDDHLSWKVAPSLLRPLLDQKDSDFEIIEG